MIGPASPFATAAALAGGRWAELPQAPIAARGDAAGVWTGTELLVWGGRAGRDSQQVLLDGAAYNPTTGAWRTLSPAPTETATDATAVWTGESMILWGGGRSQQPPTGVGYVPTIDRWFHLPPAPIGPCESTGAVWTGSAMVVAGWSPHTQPQQIATASYDPTHHTWSTLPHLLPPRHHPTQQIDLAAGAGAVYLWSKWEVQASADTATGAVVTCAGIDGFVLAAPPTWNPMAEAMQLRGVHRPIWTGRQLLQPATTPWLGHHARGRASNLTGQLIDPSTGHVHDMARGPLDALQPRHIWTGAALIAYDTGTYTSDGTSTRYPGEAAAWDPTDNQWTVLPGPNVASVGAPVAAWTGDRLLMYGQFSDPRQTNSHTTEPPPGHQLIAAPPPS